MLAWAWALRPIFQPSQVTKMDAKANLATALLVGTIFLILNPLFQLVCSVLLFVVVLFSAVALSRLLGNAHASCGAVSMGIEPGIR